MRLRQILAVVIAGLALNAPAIAQEARDPFDALNVEALFKGLIREDDVTLLFRHLRESMAAAARGDTPPESDALNRRSEEISREAFARGSVLMGVLLNAFESAAKQAIREGFGETPRKAPSAPSPFPR